MRYIDSFRFPGVENEEQFVNYISRTCYTSFYPFGVFAENQLRELSFAEITILYGNNGSGKSTALNLMAEKLKAERDTLFNKSSLLALKGARIYDLDERPVDIKKWTELEGVRTYFEFFERHKGEF